MRYPFHLALLIAVLVLAGCASTRPTLVALPAPPTTTTVVDEQAGPSILLRSVSVPGYLEAFPVVLGRADGALVVSDTTEWAERFSDGVIRVLRDALARRLGAERMLIARDGRIPDADLTIEFLSLDPVGRTLSLDARWFFACAVRTRSRGGRTHLEVPVARPTPEAVAHATTTALTRLTDELASQMPCAEQPQRRATRAKGEAP